jgi:hypothetical protein
LIPTNDHIFSTAPSTLSVWLRIPLHGRAGDTSHSKAVRSLSDINTEAQHLFRNCNVLAHDSKASEIEWDHQFGEYELEADIIGPLILARKDKKSLHVLHAMAIVAFAETVMVPLLDGYQIERWFWKQTATHFEHQKEVMTARTSILEHAKPGQFRSFWYDFKRQKIRGKPELLTEEGDKTAQMQMNLWMLDRGELLPRPEWKDIVCPYDVGKKRPSIGSIEASTILEGQA